MSSGERRAAVARREDDERLARVAWSALAEPGDVVAGAVIAALGARGALDWVEDAASAGGRGPGLGLEGAASDPRLRRAVQRWSVRLAELDVGRDLGALDALGGRVVVPGDPEWPRGLDALGAEAPACLWVRGPADVGSALTRAVSLVGARAATTYGERVAYELASGAVGRGHGVVSGGAYGIDAAAHRGALAGGGATLVVLAGGVDRTYPVGNSRLFDAVLADGGAIVSELGPGRLPTRSRFLQRNRLIAALSAATVVVEAAWRSGALSTAHHAARLLRPVGAVPGPVTSVASAGCHRLLRDGVAVCVTDVEEVLELVGSSEPATPEPGVRRPEDDLDAVGRRVRDALPRRGAHDVERLATSAGLTPDEVRASLGHLELAGLAQRSGGGWRLASDRDPG